MNLPPLVTVFLDYFPIVDVVAVQPAFARTSKPVVMGLYCVLTAGK